MKDAILLTCMKCGKFIDSGFRCDECEKHGKCQECGIKQKFIDELYPKIWDLSEEVETLKGSLITLGEMMKEHCSSEIFK